MAEISKADIEKIVREIVGNLGGSTVNTTAPSYTSTHFEGRKLIGIYSDMNEAIDSAAEGYKAVRSMSVENREKIITAIRDLTRAEAKIMAQIGVSETGMGRVDHKTAKHMLVADKTPGTEDIVSEAKTGDAGLTLLKWLLSV